MPPKKKKGNKKSGKKKSAKKAPSDTAKLHDVFNEVSKEFYLVQVRDLEDKIARYQEKCDKLELRNKDIESKFDQQASDKKEIVSFLKKQLKERSDEIADLQEKLIGLQQVKDIEKDRYELEITTLKSQMQEVKDQLTSENMVLGGKLASLEEFRLQKEDLLNKFAEMEELLKTTNKNHKEQIYQLERKAVVDKDRLKKEMILRVNTVAAEFRKVSNKQMADTTKRAIRENVSINSQLSKMSDKTMELIMENDEMKLKEKKNRQHINILEDNEKELMKKNATNQKVIRMLSEKLKEHETAVKEQQEKIKHYQQLEVQFDEVKVEIDQLQNDLYSSNNEQQKLIEDSKKLSRRKRELKEEKEYLIGILSDAVSVIKHALQHNSESGDDATTEMKNTNLLYKVIDILNLAVDMGVGIDLNELASKREQRKTKSTKYIDLGPLKISESAGLNSRLTPLSPTQKNYTHYRPGDLGIVPPPRTAPTETSGRTRKKNIESAKFYTKEQLAKGTPRQSIYELVKEDTAVKLPVLQSQTS